MTISTSNRKAGPFPGNGATVAFPFTFKVFTAADVLVVQAVTDTGVETPLALTTDYTVTLNGDQDVSPGGTVTALDAPPTGTTLTLTSQVSNLQPVALTNAGGFYPTVINDALDRLTIMAQQLAEKATRALTFGISSGASGALPNPVALAVIGWDATGTALQNFVGGASASVSTFMATVVAAVDAATARVALGASAIGEAIFTAANAAAARASLGVAIGTDVQAFNANNAVLNLAQAYSAAQRGAVNALTDAATITPDFAVANHFSVTLGGNRTLANPTNQTAGQSGVIVITQDGTGSRTLAYGSNWKFPSGTAPTLTTTAGAVDVLVYQVESASRITARLVADVK